MVRGIASLHQCRFVIIQPLSWREAVVYTQTQVRLHLSVVLAPLTPICTTVVLLWHSSSSWIMPFPSNLSGPLVDALRPVLKGVVEPGVIAADGLSDKVRLNELFRLISAELELETCS